LDDFEGQYCNSNCIGCNTSSLATAGHLVCEMIHRFWRFRLGDVLSSNFLCLVRLLSNSALAITCPAYMMKHTWSTREAQVFNTGLHVQACIEYVLEICFMFASCMLLGVNRVYRPRVAVYIGEAPEHCSSLQQILGTDCH